MIAVTVLLSLAASTANAADAIDTIARVKPSVVAVGTFERERSPPFQFRGTGFAVENGTTIVTNAHVLPGVLDSARLESLAILTPGASADTVQVRRARPLTIDREHDLALIRIDGAPLPSLQLGDSDSVREGQEVLMTGFPIGSILGPFPATHHGMISAITPIAIPQRTAAELDPAVVSRLTRGTFPVFQLDATTYPGSSGSPVYDPSTGQVFGIVNMTFVKGTKESALSQPSGISYAVPARYLQALLRNAPADASRK
ncbi:MAG: serine protease [Casimicrobiaceae bacterium]